MNKKIQVTLPGRFRTTTTKLPQQNAITNNIPQILFGISLLALAVLLSACSPSSNNPATPTPTTVIAQINLPLPTATPVPTSVDQQLTAQASLDRCALVDSQDASTYAGASFGPGEESTTAGGGRICTYGSETANVFMVEVAQAPDVATAVAAKADFLAMLQASAQKLASGGLNVTQLPAFADGATMAQLNTGAGGVAINGSAIGVLKGAIFFGFSDVVMGGAAPSATAVQAEATTLLGLLP